MARIFKRYDEEDHHTGLVSFDDSNTLLWVMFAHDDGRIEDGTLYNTRVSIETMTKYDWTEIDLFEAVRILGDKAHV